MASLRPSKCYRWDSPAYTRVSNNPSDSFITGIPASKIVHFDMGNPAGKFNTKVELVYRGNTQVRHNALEASRIIVQKRLETLIGVANYYFKINVYPHHVMRQNVQASGAGADRVSEGMRRAYGKPIGRAARVKRNQALFTVKFNRTDQRMKVVKTAFKLASNKLPGEKSIVISELEK